jgi:ferrochelatase
VILLGYGAPTGLDDIERFLTAVFGSAPSPHIVSATQARYERIGGRSPLVSDLTSLAAFLDARLAHESVIVRAGFRFSAPTIADVVGSLGAAGIRSFVGIPFTPFYSVWSWEGYRAAFEKAISCANPQATVVFADPYYNHPALVEAWVRAVSETWSRVSPSPVLFSAHSLLLTDAAAWGTYPSQVAWLASKVAERVGIGYFAVAYQSVGRRGGEWLGPTIDQYLEERAEKLARAADPTLVVVPIGFLSENVETLVDLDIEYAKKLAAHDITLVRVPTPFAAGTLAQAYEEIVRDVLARTSV